MASDKAPGLDGFNMRFFQHQWNLVKNDIVAMVQQLFRTRFLLKEMNATFLALIPKVDNPQIPTEFKPISLYNSTYKIISKILANRLRPVLSKIISQVQSEFMPNRKITDNIVLAQELIHTMNKNKKKRT